MIKFLTQNQPTLHDKIIVISGISIGGVPTYALDLLIAANGFKRIGFIASEHIEPAVGYLHKNIEQGALGLGCQLYQLGNVIIIQVRAGIRFGRRKQFIQQIANLINSQGKNPQLFVLSCLPFSLRPDLQIQSLCENIYYYSKSESQFEKGLKNCKGFKSIRQLLDADDQDTQIINESGLLKQISKSQKLPKVCSIFVFSPQMIDKNLALLLAKGVRALLGVEMNIKQLSQTPCLQILQ